MQMVIMTFRSSLEDIVLEWLELEHRSFTFVEKAHGKGSTGSDLRAIYWGGNNTMLFAGIQDEELDGFQERIAEWQRKLSQDGTVLIPLHVFVLPGTQWF